MAFSTIMSLATKDIRLSHTPGLKLLMLLWGKCSRIYKKHSSENCEHSCYTTGHFSSLLSIIVSCIPLLLHCCWLPSPEISWNTTVTYIQLLHLQGIPIEFNRKGSSTFATGSIWRLLSAPLYWKERPETHVCQVRALDWTICSLPLILWKPLSTLLNFGVTVLAIKSSTQKRVNQILPCKTQHSCTVLTFSGFLLYRTLALLPKVEKVIFIIYYFCYCLRSLRSFNWQQNACWQTAKSRAIFQGFSTC